MFSYKVSNHHYMKLQNVNWQSFLLRSLTLGQLVYSGPKVQYFHFFPPKDAFGLKSFSNKALHQEAKLTELGSKYVITKNERSCFWSHHTPCKTVSIALSVGTLLSDMKQRIVPHTSLNDHLKNWCKIYYMVNSIANSSLLPFQAHYSTWAGKVHSSLIGAKQSLSPLPRSLLNLTAGQSASQETSIAWGEIKRGQVYYISWARGKSLFKLGLGKFLYIEVISPKNCILEKKFKQL